MFKDKIVLITGANSGIGRACAEQFSGKGALVLGVSRRKELSDEVELSINRNGGKAEFYQCDLRSSDEIHQLFDCIINKYGKLDYLVNNAGIDGASYTKITDYPESVWDDVLNTNLKSVWLCVKRALQVMVNQKYGAIVNIASVAGLQASITGGVAYTASKFGVIGITRAAALEVADLGIRINAVCPGFVRTPMAEMVLGDRLESVAKNSCPMGRACESEEVAKVVAWLCSKEASFITGVALPVDGGTLA